MLHASFTAASERFADLVAAAASHLAPAMGLLHEAAQVLIA
ncbi:MAG: hypothetical protein AAF763_08770 [Pseudomonadota bacterium]